MDHDGAEPDMAAEHSHDASGALVVQSAHGRMRVSAVEGRAVIIGRAADQVHICVGPDDLGVSRKHVLLQFHDARWWVQNIGRRPVLLPSGELRTISEPLPVLAGHTPLIITGTGDRTHHVDLHVDERDGAVPGLRRDVDTMSLSAWPLAPDELLIMVVLAQRYLVDGPDPQPLSWSSAASELQHLDPDGRWTAKRVEHKVARLRNQLSRRGVAGLDRTDIEGPFGYRLLHNLIRELLRTSAIVPADLALLHRKNGE